MESYTSKVGTKFEVINGQNLRYLFNHAEKKIDKKRNNVVCDKNK